MEFDMFMRPVVEDTTGMSYPMRCKWCHTIHDASKVVVVQRYSDCSVWRCPNCNVLGDDRPISWGGSFELVRTSSGAGTEDANA